MRKLNFWITLSFINLVILASFGLTLRTKFLFSIPAIDYKNFLSAHSHFAFGGWVTLILMVLFINFLLDENQKQRKVYQWILWGIEITSLGMAASFPFRGYAAFSIIFSTSFIFFTYWFGWVFIKDILKSPVNKTTRTLAICALVSCIVSSIGPFTLAYIMSTNTGNTILFRDSVYTYLHFQYNGFFTLSVFALLFDHVIGLTDERMKKSMHRFAVVLCLSVIPTLFLSLLWHSYNIYFRSFAFIGCILIIIALFYFIQVMNRRILAAFKIPLARVLLILSMTSFAIKMLLQMGTIIPALGHAVFGYRPIIIGFLHLVFLGLVSFFILSLLVTKGIYSIKKPLAVYALTFFSAAVILNELILLVDGIGLMFYTTNRIFPWLLWVASMFLVTGAALILTAWLRTARQQVQPTIVQTN